MPSLKEQIRTFKEASHEERLAMYDDLAVPMAKQIGKTLLICIGILIFIWGVIPLLIYIAMYLISLTGLI